MEIKSDYDFNDLVKNCWSGATNTLDMISEKGYEDELMSHLEEVFYDDIPTLAEVNDYLWFEEDSIKESLGIFELEENIDVAKLEKVAKRCETCRKPRMITNADLNAYDDLVDGSMSESDLSEQIDEITDKLGEVEDKIDELLDCDNQDDFDSTKDELDDLNSELNDLATDYVNEKSDLFGIIQRDIVELLNTIL